MAIELFWGSGSPESWRVLLALELKGLDYDSRLLSFAKNEHRAPGFLAMNPRHKVPVLKDGDVVLAESLAILAYLDARYPQAPPLFGRAPEETGRVWRAVLDLEHYVAPAADKIVSPLFYNRPTDGVADAVADLHAELRGVQARLARQPWLCGERISAADLVAFPVFKQLERAASKPAAASLDLGLLPRDQRWPELSAWAARIEAIPGYDKTTPPHWRN